MFAADKAYIIRIWWWWW